MTWMITFDSHILSPAFTPHLTYTDSRTAQRDAGRPRSRWPSPAIPTALPEHARRRGRCKGAPRQGQRRPSSASGALLLTSYLQKANGFELNQIYYKGGGPTVQDVLAGSPISRSPPQGALQPHFRAGKLRALATTGDKRAPGLPDVLTLGEQGLQT